MDFENIEMKEYVQSDQLIGDIIREYPIAVGGRNGTRSSRRGGPQLCQRAHLHGGSHDAAGDQLIPRLVRCA